MAIEFDSASWPCAIGNDKQTVAEISRFIGFQMAAVGHLGFSKIRNFNGRSSVGAQCASSFPINSSAGYIENIFVQDYPSEPVPER